MQRNITFLGIPIIKIKKTENYEKRYFLGVQYKVKKFGRRYNTFKEAFEENIPFIHNRKITVILNNLGEAVIYARTAQYWYQKDTLMFGLRPQHAEVFKMFAPDIPVFYCGEGSLIEDDYSNGNTFSALLYDKELIAINNQGKSFWKMWEKHLKCDFSTIKLNKAIISKQDVESALNKAKALHINLQKFVFLMPKARSHQFLPEKFWKDIENSLKKLGYDVIYNSKIFSIAEAYVLATKAKAIIALRSGLNDVFSEISTPQFLIYSHNSWHGDLQPMYSMKNFPWAAKDFITEYNTHSQSIENIKDDILKKIR